MMPAILGLTLTLLLAAEPADGAPRKPHPLAPSLPQLSDAEEEQIDRTIDRFILYDTGRLPGAEGKQALSDFQKLGPEAIPALIRGLNRAAAIDHSCPAVTIARKLDRMLKASNDPDLLDFARENIGAGVTRSRHLGLLRDLRVACMIRKRSLPANAVATLARTREPANDLRAMTLSELADLAATESGPRLRQVVTELGRRGGEQAVTALGTAAAGGDAETKRLAREALGRQLASLDPAALKDRLRDPQAEVRAAAAETAGRRAPRLGGDLIPLLKDSDTAVRQAARAALVRLSRGMDFGPEPAASPAQQEEAVRRWQAWWEQQRN